MNRVQGAKTFLGLVLAVGLFSNCSSSNTSSFSGTFSSASAIASPTTAGSRASLSTRYFSRAAETVQADATASDKAAALEAVATATTEAGCAVVLPTLSAFGSPRDSCYGPSITYSNHQDGADANPASLPGGDLGIWELTGSDATSACAAAQLNSLIQNAAHYSDFSLALIASFSCLAGQAGSAIPGVGETLDLKTELAASVAAGNTSVTITAATLVGVTATSYHYTISGTVSGGSAFTIELKHNEISSTSEKGKLWGHLTGTSNLSAFTLEYVNDGAARNYLLDTGDFTASATDYQDADGDLAYTGASNRSHFIGSDNPTAGTGDYAYAWQAGSGDSNTRVFQAHVDGTSGCGFYAYGASFSTTASANTNTISKFICNWSGPGNSHTGVSGKAQKQCFTNSGSGFAATSSSATYAPTNSCNDTSGMTYQWPTHSGNGATNNLVTTSSDTDYANFTLPSAPDSGF